MPTQIYLEQHIECAIRVEDFVRICNSALRKNNWTEPYIDTKTATLVAHQRFHNFVRGTRWNFDFTASLEWDQIQEVAETLHITIHERNYDWTHDFCNDHGRRLLQAILDGCERYEGLTAAKPPATKGARWATLPELHKAGYIGPANQEQLIVSAAPADASFNKTFGLDEQQFVRLPFEDSIRHALVCGPTGSGKSTGIFIPNLIHRIGSSALVTEATSGGGVADLYRKTAGFRAANGHDVFYFNPDDPCSNQVNPIGGMTEYRHARHACEVIMNSTTLKTHRGDQSWEMSERLLLTGMLLHTISMKEHGQCHLAYVNDLLKGGIMSLENILPNSPIQEAREQYSKFIETTTDQYRNLVANGVINRLDIWNWPAVRKVTETTTMDLTFSPEIGPLQSRILP